VTVDSMLSRNYFVTIELECAEVARNGHTPLVSNSISISISSSMSSRVSMLDADVERSKSASLALVP